MSPSAVILPPKRRPPPPLLTIFLFLGLFAHLLARKSPPPLSHHPPFPVQQKTFGPWLSRRKEAMRPPPGDFFIRKIENPHPHPFRIYIVFSLSHTRKSAPCPKLPCISHLKNPPSSPDLLRIYLSIPHVGDINYAPSSFHRVSQRHIFYFEKITETFFTYFVQSQSPYV